MTLMTVPFAVAGAGSRGNSYTRWAQTHPDGTVDGDTRIRAELAAVAEPRGEVMDSFLAEYDPLGKARRYPTWQALLADPPSGLNTVLICTQDPDHLASATAFAAAGWNVLLEKPMAVTEPDCEKIVEAVEAGGGIFAVCHVLRYTPYTARIKELLAEGRIGEVMTIEHLEPIGYWHYAHSFVRGPWSIEAESAPIVLAKTCHDLDWLTYVAGKRVRRVHSFGSLVYFRPERKPAAARTATRCTDCPISGTCTYSATRIYPPRYTPGIWPALHLVERTSPGALEEALRAGPYGRCVWESGNDVCDQQSVTLEFEDGTLASMLLSACTPLADRKTRIMGTEGYLEGDGENISVYTFATETTDDFRLTRDGEMSAAGGHGGGDFGVMRSFTVAVALGDPSRITTSPRQSLHSHHLAFAAERSRRTGTVETIR
jgi:predicted dehydrogenase